MKSSVHRSEPRSSLSLYLSVSVPLPLLLQQLIRGRRILVRRVPSTILFVLLFTRSTFSGTLKPRCSSLITRCLEERRARRRARTGRREASENLVPDGRIQKIPADQGRADEPRKELAQEPRILHLPFYYSSTRSYVRLFLPLSIYFLSLSSFLSNLHSRRYGLSRTSLLVSSRELPL